MLQDNLTNSMRVLLITQGISRIVEPVFCSGHDVVGVLESMPRDYEKESKQVVLVSND